MMLEITLNAGTDDAFPATDLGFLLHKNPAVHFAKSLTFGTAHVVYPEASATRCTAALIVEVDPVGLVRGRPTALASYVSDRPYVASSFLSVAIAEVFGTALGGRCKERPELAETPLDLTATLPALDCDAGEPLIRRLFEPLGYLVETERLPLDTRFPDWGDSDLYRVTLRARTTLQRMLGHLYVLIPVLDNAKHYGVGQDEVEKLLRRGANWLAEHPERDLIARRYLRYQRQLANDALARLAAVEESVENPDASQTVPVSDGEEKTEAPLRLNDQRIGAAITQIRQLDPPARRVIDLGCGEGRTLEAVRRQVPGLETLAGMDVSSAVLERAARRLRLIERGDDRLRLFLGSLVYRDRRLEGYDVALLMEVIEHLDPDRLHALEAAVFQHARPRRVVVTTPNSEYNTVWESLPAEKFRHKDHRFEWTRSEFQAWAERVAAAHDYRVSFHGIGEDDAENRGTPTQMAVFDQAESLPA